MEIKKSNFLEDPFKLSSFYADNRRYASVSSVSTRLKTHQRANQKRGYIEKYVNIIDALARLGTCEVRRTNRSRSFAVLFDKLSRIERQSRPKYKSAVPELIHTSNLTCAEPNN